MNTQKKKSALKKLKCPLVDERLYSIFWDIPSDDKDKAIRDLYDVQFSKLAIAIR